MVYQPRTYRQDLNPERFAEFTLQYLDTDLWIGVDHGSFRKEIAETALREVVSLRTGLDRYIHRQPLFRTSLVPVNPLDHPFAPVTAMAEAGIRTGTGPMSSVAGMFARQVGERIRKKFRVKELVVENGGDCYIFIKEDLLFTIYAGDSPLSEKIAVIVPANETPCGVCTSSGTVGPSFSFGKADAVTVSCYSPLLADAWATALGNRVRSPGDIESVLTFSEKIPEILSLVIICGDKTGIRGKFEVRFIHTSA